MRERLRGDAWAASLTPTRGDRASFAHEVESLARWKGTSRASRDAANWSRSDDERSGVVGQKIATGQSARYATGQSARYDDRVRAQTVGGEVLGALARTNERPGLASGAQTSRMTASGDV